MADERVKKAVELIRAFLVARKIAVDKLVVFGSYAKGNYSQNSDVDIAIISESFNGKDIFQRADMLKGLKWALVEKFMLPFDVVPISAKEWENDSSLVVGFVKEGLGADGE